MKLAHVPEARAAAIKEAIECFCKSNNIPGMRIVQRKHAGIVSWCENSTGKGIFTNTEDWTIRISWDVFQFCNPGWIRHKINIGSDVSSLPNFRLSNHDAKLLQNKYRANMIIWCGRGTKDLRFCYNPNN